MRIGIDARPLSHQLAGTGRLVLNLVMELERLDQANDYFLYSKGDFRVPFENPRWRKRLQQKRRFEPSSYVFQTGVRQLIVEDRIDVFWETIHVLPFGLPGRLGKIVTVYDLVWRIFPETAERKFYYMQRLFTEPSIRRADRLICDSHSTLHDLGRILGVPLEKVLVIYPGVLPDYRPRDPKYAAQYIARKYQTSENYICTVGTVEPRKNVVALVEAVRILRARGDFGAQLLIAGGSGWRNSSIYESVGRAGLTEREIKFLGYVPEEDLPTLYSGARIFVFPSLYEGFGIPLIEAMACGVPVVASNVSSIPEVVQDAGILVSPRRPQEFADAVARLESDPELRFALIEKGLRRARDFRYDIAAQKVLRLFEEVAAEVQRR
jgi:glycosyltransferase involved in cell wall biosynthesis